jgi:hypothetical protein
MDAYLLIGNPNTRKSSVIRSLSGCFNRSVRDIQLLQGKAPLRLYARASSVQQSRRTPEDFVAEVAASRCAAVLCGLLPSALPDDPQAYPQALTYIGHFGASGWRIRAIAVLGQNGGGVRGANVRQFPLAPTTPINVVARDVRAFFGWH